MVLRFKNLMLSWYTSIFEYFCVFYLIFVFCILYFIALLGSQQIGGSGTEISHASPCEDACPGSQLSVSLARTVDLPQLMKSHCHNTITKSPVSHAGFHSVCVCVMCRFRDVQWQVPGTGTLWTAVFFCECLWGQFLYSMSNTFITQLCILLTTACHAKYT